MDTKLKNTATNEMTNKQAPLVNKVDIKELISGAAIGDDPIAILKQAQEDLDNIEKKQDMTTKSSLFKALTIFEFDKGVLMTSSIPEKYRPFSIELSRNLQKEYQCEKPSEKATAELVALNFVRVLIIQEKLTSFLALGSVTDTTAKYFGDLSKELDRANRHYLNSLQTLKAIKLPALEVNIKTQTAVVGQNQIVQSNNK